MLFTFGFWGGTGDRGLSDAGGGSGGVWEGCGSALSAPIMNEGLFAEIRPFSRWLVVMVLLLASPWLEVALDDMPPCWSESGLPPRPMIFSATKVSSIPVGAPTFLRTDSFSWRCLASASNLTERTIPSITDSTISAAKAWPLLCLLVRQFDHGVFFRQSVIDRCKYLGHDVLISRAATSVKGYMNMWRGRGDDDKQANQGKGHGSR